MVLSNLQAVDAPSIQTIFCDKAQRCVTINLISSPFASEIIIWL